MKMGAEAISTADRPVGTVRSPNVISMNGRAIANSPSSSAVPGRRRTSERKPAAPPPPRRTTTSSASAASAVRPSTTSDSGIVSIASAIRR